MRPYFDLARYLVGYVCFWIVIPIGVIFLLSCFGMLFYLIDPSDYTDRDREATIANFLRFGYMTLFCLFFVALAYLPIPEKKK